MRSVWSLGRSWAMIVMVRSPGLVKIWAVAEGVAKGFFGGVALVKA